MNVFLLIICILMLQHSKCQNQQDVCKYKQVEFDSDTCCWRYLSKKDSFLLAANLIVAYLNCNIKSNNTHALQWHAGQMFACAGQQDDAKKYFHKTYNVFYKWFGGKDGQAWYYYAKGTIAFIDGNKRKLHSIIQKWNKKLPKDKNYHALVQLYNNFGKTYQEATL